MLLVLALSSLRIVTGVMCNGNSPLTNAAGVRLFCGRGPQSVTCPTGSSCEVEPADAYAVCCPNLPSAVAKCPSGVPLTSSSGSELFCGRGPNRVECPANSQCVVDPLDRFAVCCPTPSKCSSGLPLKSSIGVELFCGRGLNRVDCPTGSKCVIDPGDRFAVCCPDSNFKKCPKGDALSALGVELNCGQGPNHVECPSGYKCADRFGVCCPEPPVVGGNSCPKGVPIVNCFVDPCQFAKCAVPGARCVSNYCGGCNAVWYGPDNKVIKCDASSSCPPVPDCANPPANCRYERPPTDYNGCVIGCGTLSCNSQPPVQNSGKGKGNGKNGKSRFGSNRVILPGGN